MGISSNRTDRKAKDRAPVEKISQLINLLRSGNADEVITKAKQFIKFFPKDPQILQILGGAHAALNQLDEAITCFRKALKYDQKSADIHYNIGLALQKKGDISAAVDSYSISIGLNPNHFKALNNLANLYAEQGDVSDAVGVYIKVIEIEPNYAQAHNNLGNAFKEQGDLIKARESYNRALEIDSGFAEARYNMGIILQELGRYSESLRCFEEAVQLYPSSSAGIARSKSFALKNLLALGEADRFCSNLDEMVRGGYNDALIGSMCAIAYLKFGVHIKNPFCEHPLNYVEEKSLLGQCDFSSIFLEPAKKIINETLVSNKKQDLVQNGVQTSGNLFADNNYFSPSARQIIELELEKYKEKLTGKGDGFLLNWPSRFSLTAWLVSYNSGGSILPHIHENGWVSGSIYINVPQQSDSESGNLVVSLDDSPYEASQKGDSKRVIDVKTGSLCLFPASLYHSTLPFESCEQRIVLAFDVNPI